ncbi:MAG: TlpA disulfide reductase family protein [Acidobacteriota bacterium]|nr:TlpA disulfide reductase family protein [Acidobacteriota bacterium]
MAATRSMFQLILAGLLMAGLAGATLAWRPETPVEDPGVVVEEEIPELSAGAEAPDFDLPLISGGRIVLEDVLDERPVLLVVWAVWCPPCVAEFQELQRLHEEYASSGLQILAVGVRYNQTLEEVRLFARDQGVEFPVLYDEREKVVQRYGITYIPTNFLIDRDGVIEYSSYGLPTDLEERVQALLENA